MIIQVHQQLDAYARLREVIEYYADLDVLPFESDAADRFAQLRRTGIRIGTMYLKIASIALAHDALLLTANATDFGKVPGLQIENWMN